MAMIVATLMRQPVDPDERNHQVREIHYFLPLNAKEKEAFEERYGVTLLNNYGSTECLIGAITDPPHGERRWPSIGQAGPGYAVRIADCQGTELPEGQVGEILLHGVPGVSLMAGYWNNPEATAEVLSEDGWYRTHDFAYVEDGWVYFMDRRIDLIKRSGESVSSAEVECTIESLDGVQEVAVIGVPDGVRPGRQGLRRRGTRRGPRPPGRHRPLRGTPGVLQSAQLRGVRRGTPAGKLRQSQQATPRNLLNPSH
mgnify:CR=1 FL=1